jgi:hypothetical protein
MYVYPRKGAQKESMDALWLQSGLKLEFRIADLLGIEPRTSNFSISNIKHYKSI